MDKEPTKSMDVELWPVAKPKPYKRNAKNHPKEQVELLAKVIRKHGFDQPIVVDKKGVVIKGHGRLLAARHLGLTTVPVIVRDDLTPAQVAEARIADNRVAEFGWDFEALVADVVDGLKVGLDMDFVGFTLRDLGLDKPEAAATDESGSRADSGQAGGDGDEEKKGTGEIQIEAGAHTCPRCAFTFDD